MPPLLQLYLFTTGALLIVGWFFQLLGVLGSFGRWIGDALCRAPLLDFALFYFTALPAIIGMFLRGWLGLAKAGIRSDAAPQWRAAVGDEERGDERF